MIRFLVGLGLYVFLLLALAKAKTDINIRVGIYNSIPDLNNDSLSSLKAMIEREFMEYTEEKYTVEAIVDPSEYNPYSDDLPFLASKFDLMEIDTTTLQTLVLKSAVMDMEEVEPNINISQFFPASIKAGMYEETLYAYPTLVCGNFITSVTPASESNCPISGVQSYQEYKHSLETCRNNLMGNRTTYKRLVEGKMNDSDGWYLPYIYLDGYIDIHGANGLDEGVKKLKSGEVDQSLCERLRWFIGLCNDSKESVCVNGKASDNSVVNHESVLKFSFSEKLSEDVKKLLSTDRLVFGLSSVSMGDGNALLQFTDSLVVSKTRWKRRDKFRNAIRKFIDFYTSLRMRYKIAYGFDLMQPQIRYLLVPNKEFYTKTAAVYDPIYKNAHEFLKGAVPAPAFTFEERKKMQHVLNTECLVDKKSKTQAKDPERKTEL